MFKREAKEDLQIQTLISAPTRIQGDVLFSGGLQLEGKVSGSVKATPDAPSRLVASATALIEGSVEAQVVGQIAHAVVRAGAECESHSRSRRRMLSRFDSTRASCSRRSAFSSR